jgi:hypothetical protein
MDVAAGCGTGARGPNCRDGCQEGARQSARAGGRTRIVDGIGSAVRLGAEQEAKGIEVAVAEGVQTVRLELA